MTVPYDDVHVATSPVRAVEQFVAVGNHIGWDMSKGYLFPSINPPRPGEPPVRGSVPLSTRQMSQPLKRHATNPGEKGEFSMHFFQWRGAVSRALAGEYLSSIMQRALWKSPRTAWTYMRLMEVVAPGTEGDAMAEGVSEDQYRSFKEFPLRDQSRSWAALGDQPML